METESVKYIQGMAYRQTQTHGLIEELRECNCKQHLIPMLVNVLQLTFSVSHYILILQSIWYV